MKIHNKKVSFVLRILVGLAFMASAILKYISIEIFDLYIFEHNLFSISVTETLTRMLIAAELVLGIMLIFNICAKLAYYATLSLLVAFTLYLIILPCCFDVDITNCHCFGEAVIFNRTESIIKNIILLLCLLFVSPKFSTFRKWEIWILITLSIITLSILMLINAPNYLYSMVRKEKTQIDMPMYKSALLNSNKEEEFTHGKQLICMYSVGCKFCKRAALKLHLILKNNQLPEDNVKAVFWGGTPDSIVNKFFSEQRIPLPEYTTFRVDTFLFITDGRRPVILFSDNGTIVHSESYVTLSEKAVVGFLNGDR